MVGMTEGIGLHWSQEYPFTQEVIIRYAPQSPGVYQIHQSWEYPVTRAKLAFSR